MRWHPFLRLHLLLASAALAALTACGGGPGAPDRTAATNPISPGSPTEMTLVPQTINVATGASWGLQLYVTPNTASVLANWSISGAGCLAADCGSINVHGSHGTYTAPRAAPSPATVTVTATSVANPALSTTMTVIVGPQNAGTFRSAGSMRTARAGHSATLLADGRVLIAGGDGARESGGPSAEIYDPATGTFTPTASMNASRAWHTATLLPNGQVLIVGPEASLGAEIFDPTSGTFALLGAALTEQCIRTATLLENGKVLVAGSVDAALYDPATGSFMAAGAYATQSFADSATLLADGRVLFVGGNPAQLYDPARSAFVVAGSLATVATDGLHGESATLLDNGQVLIGGGSNNAFPGGPVGAAELYDLAGTSFVTTGSLLEPRSDHAAVRLADGNVLVVGGAGRYVPAELKSIELYASSTGSFAAAGAMAVARIAPRATLLKNGDVLVTGGYRSTVNCFTSYDDCIPIEPIAEAELYVPH